MQIILKRLGLLLGSIALSCCAATANAPQGGGIFSSGFTASPVGDDGYYVAFSGNGFTTDETVQTYFLYNVAVLVLNKGYEGFELASSTVDVTSGNPGGIGGPATALLLTGVLNHSALQDNIRVLKKPFSPMPPKVFDASALKQALEPYVNGKKCNGGNVCPHAHYYLYPDPNLGQSMQN